MTYKFLLSIGLLSLLFILWQFYSQPAQGQFLLSSPSLFKADRPKTFSPATEQQPFFQSEFASHESTPEVHSATAIELADNNIMAFWYGGTREGHKDVAIYQNIWNSQTKKWGQETSLLTRTFTRDNTRRYIRKLGNPVVARGPDNGIWLFYVSVSVGGWAGSAINLIRSYDEGLNWSKPKRLISSPFFNLSTLIKGSPVLFSDNTLGLPVYHELLGKFGELLKINSSGDVINKTRLSWGKTSLQPIIFPLSSNNALAMMRYHGSPPNRILIQTSHDAGLSWSVVKKSSLPNPDAGIFGLRLKHSQQLLLAFNNSEEERDDMTLARSADQGKTWNISKVIEENRLTPPNKNKQFSYPWLLQTQNGHIHLLYTWHKDHIKHAVFNPPWLNRTKPGEITP